MPWRLPPTPYASRISAGASRPVYAPADVTRRTDMAHAKDKGAKNVKKKAQKSVKEKRVEKKLKKETRERTLGE
jgi:hypothetical protein